MGREGGERTPEVLRLRGVRPGAGGRGVGEVLLLLFLLLSSLYLFSAVVDVVVFIFIVIVFVAVVVIIVNAVAATAVVVVAAVVSSINPLARLQVVLAGGYDGENYTASTDIFDVQTGKIQQTEILISHIVDHARSFSP